jgi:DNA-binding NtrC family response regulator
LDITLYDEDGLAVLHDIKEVDKTITVVMVTAYKSADKVVQAFRDGAMDCLLKPINFDYLENYILAKIGTQIKTR